jgi:hypothetical protein
MKPLNLQEYAEQLRLTGDSREIDFADMILQLLDIEEAVAEPFDALCDDLRNYADTLPEAPTPKELSRAMEWVGDRSDLLKEIEAELDKDGRTGDTDDQIKAMLETLENIRTALGLPDTATDEDLATHIQALADREPEDERLLRVMGFTKEQAADAMGKDPKDRTPAEQALIVGLTAAWDKPKLEYDL